MSFVNENFRDLIGAISDPACFVGHDLSVLCGNEAFFVFSGIDYNGNAKNIQFDECLTLSHSWHDDVLITNPFQEKCTAIRNNITVKNSSNNNITVSMSSIPFFNDSEDVETALIIISKQEIGGYRNEQILEIIEQQEDKLKEVEGRNKETVLSNKELKNLIEKQDRQLVEANQTLQRVKEEINDELEMAKSVQTSLMPKELPDFTNITISSVYIPAGKVGGDFYDIINTQSQKIAILIFDVSGHGIPAALIGATAKMLFAHYIEILESPSTIFSEINTKLCSFIQTEHYLTAFLGILDPIQNCMVYSRAGHVKPIVYHAADKKISTLDARSFFIGHSALVDIAKYNEETVSFDSDDKILFYTDGLTEGCNPDNELYGKDRLMKVVKDNGDLPLSDLLNRIIEDQECFRQGTELRDDFTMLCIKIGDSGHLLKESGFSREDAPSVLIINKMNEIDKVCSVILRAMDNCGFSDNEIKRAKVCLFEMILNSILHGNQNNPNKKVLLLYKIAQEKIVISVVDEGNGYEYKNLPNPLTDKNLLKESGRGVYIIKNYMDEVHFNKKGNRILVVKYHKGEK